MNPSLFKVLETTGDVTVLSADNAQARLDEGVLRQVRR